MNEKKELSPYNIDAFPISDLAKELLMLILEHLGVGEIISNIRLVNKDWKNFADRLIKEKINLKKEELRRRFIEVKKNVIEDEEEFIDVHTIDKGIRQLIIDAAQNNYLPLIWEKTFPNDDKETLEKKTHFNKTLQKFVSAIAHVRYTTTPIFKHYPLTEEERLDNEAKLVRKNLQNSHFNGSDDYTFSWVRLPNTNIRGANFTGSELGHANLNNMDLSDTNFTNAKLGWASFSGANLSRANFTNVEFGNGWNKLDGVNLTGANFTNAELYGTDLANISLKDVNLTNANLSHCKNLHSDTLLYASHLKGIKLPLNFELSYMNLCELDLTGASMQSIQLNNAYLLNTNLTEAKASSANFNGANLTSVIIKAGRFADTNFSGCQMAYADLSNAFVDGANFDGADLTGANLFNVDLRATKNITAEQLLSAGSLIEVVIDNTMFTKEELKLIKNKMLNDYKIFFKENRFDTVLELLLRIKNNETHTLKIQRDFSIHDYALTASYSEVINYGRKRLVELSKTQEFTPPQPDTEEYEKLKTVFNAPIYSWHANFWGNNDNAPEALKSILGQSHQDVDYQFRPQINS